MSRNRWFVTVLLAAAVTLILGFLGALAASFPSWSTKSPMPTSRSMVGVSAVQGRVYAIGGYAGSAPFGTVEEYDPIDNSWSTKTAMPTPRKSVGVAALEDRVFVFGGRVFGGPHDTTSAVEVYYPITDTWSSASAMSVARAWPSVGVVNGKIYVIGGFITPDPHVTSIVEEYDPATNTWAVKSPMPTPRYGAGTGVVDGRIYVIAGRGENTPESEYPTVIEVYDPVEDEWTTVSPKPSRLAFAGWATFGGRIYAFGGQYAEPTNGGFSTSAVATVEEYDPATESWRTLSPMTYARESLGAALVGVKVYAVGGYLDLAYNEEGDLFANDVTPPTGSIAINGGALDTPSSTVRIEVSAEDTESGVYQMAFSNDGSGFSSWEAFATEKEWILDPGDGQKTVYARFRDYVGNISADCTDGISLDTSVPSAYGVSINDGALYTNQTAVTLTLGAEALTAEMMVSNDGGFGGSNWEAYAAHPPWEITEYGAYVIPRTVYVRFRDVDGATSGTYQDDIVLDPNPPTSQVTSVTPPEPSQAVRISAVVPLTITWTGTDDVSGIKGFDIQYKVFTGGQWTDWLISTAQTSGAFDATGGLTYFFRSRAQDLADNWEDYPSGDGDVSIHVEGELDYKLCLPLAVKNH